MLFAIPNGGKRDTKTAGAMKMEGVVPGIPDIFFAKPNKQFHGLFIEMKKVEGSYLSLPQRQALACFESQGYQCVVAKGCKEALEALQNYVLID